MLMAEAICWRIARCGSETPDSSIIISSRPRHSRGLLAWIVAIEPSWPVDIACNMSKTSAPRTSPTIIRSGTHPQRVTHQLARGDLALALQVGRAGLQPHHVGLLERQLGRVLNGDDTLVRRHEAGETVEHGGLA